jgi:hypothetical protein
MNWGCRQGQGLKKDEKRENEFIVVVANYTTMIKDSKTKQK